MTREERKDEEDIKRTKTPPKKGDDDCRGAYLDKRRGEWMSRMVPPIPTLSLSGLLPLILITPIGNPVNPGPNCRHTVPSCHESNPQIRIRSEP